MLLKFRVSNWRSIREPQELTLYRSSAGAKSMADDSDSPWDTRVSSLAAIYGPNASGKSTLVDALRFCQYAVLDSYRSWSPAGGTPRIPFVLAFSAMDEPSTLEVEFRINGKDYQYGFSLDDDEIKTEYLYLYATSRRTVLFERGLSEVEPWYFGPSFKGPASRIRDTTRDNSLFLSAAAAAGSSTLSDVYEWFRSCISIYDAPAYEIEHEHVARRIRDDSHYRDRLLAFLSHSDLGVNGILSGDDDDLEITPQPDRSELSTFSRISIRSGLPGEDKEEPESESGLRLSHSTENADMDLPFEWESDGTKALISFASIALKALDSGTVCVVDEIDTSLHPVLVAELVSIFANPMTNPLQAQLVFTTHDVSLLRRWDQSSHGLEKDQVWLVEKTRDGSSSLTALLEYGRARKDENLARAYLTGRFGAIPSTSISLALLAMQGDEEDELAERE